MDISFFFQLSAFFASNPLLWRLFGFFLFFVFWTFRFPAHTNHSRANRDYSFTQSKYNDSWDAFKADVLDFEIISYNDEVYQQRMDKRGNLIVRKEEYTKGKSGATILHEGIERPKFLTKSKEVVYRGKWIIGTDFIYDYGLATNMKRSKPNRAVTDLSYHFYSYNFKDMRAVGMMERIIPIMDEYQLSIYKIQNFKNKWIPYIIDIDLQALEDVALGDGGKKMTPKQLMNMVSENFTLVSRRSDLAGNNVNYKAVNIIPTGMGNEYNVLVGELVRLVTEMRDILGFNEVTDGSSPNPNMLNYVASLGAEATNNALRALIEADKKLGINLAKGVIQRMVQAVKQKKIEGLLPALGKETMQFITVSPDVALHDWGIMLDDKPSVEERQMLLQQLAGKEMNDLIDPSDYIMVMETQNLKQARVLLAHRVQKRRKEKEAYELQKMQMNGQVQQQSALTAEQARQETLKLEYQLKSEMEIALKTMDMEMLRMKLEGANAVADKQKEGKIETQKTANLKN